MLSEPVSEVMPSMVVSHLIEKFWHQLYFLKVKALMRVLLLRLVFTLHFQQQSSPQVYPQPYQQPFPQEP